MLRCFAETTENADSDVSAGYILDVRKRGYEPVVETKGGDSMAEPEDLSKTD